MEKPCLKDYLTTENVEAAKGGYGDISSAAADIENVANSIEINCVRKIPHFVKVKDSLSENTTTNLSEFKSVCKSTSSKIESSLGSGFEGSTFETEAKKKDAEIAKEKYDAALARYNRWVSSINKQNELLESRYSEIDAKTPSQPVPIYKK